mmetsp:Transcript_19372/g.39605  ORF Transcript_19372/g.39605 Transcript_19372/m.39605 type:complete len:275 (-) Transcript_19372:724-1548(-)
MQPPPLQKSFTDKQLLIYVAMKYPSIGDLLDSPETEYSPDTVTANSWQMIYKELPASEARLREEVGLRVPRSGGLNADALVPPPPLGLPSMQREPASAAPPPVQHKEPTAAASPTDYGGSDPPQSAPDHGHAVLTWDLDSGRDGWSPATVADLTAARSAQAAAAYRRRQSSQERRRRGVCLVSTERLSSFEFAFESAVKAMKRLRLLRTTSWGHGIAQSAVALKATGATDDKSIGLRSSESIGRVGERGRFEAGGSGEDGSTARARRRRRQSFP